MFKTIQKRCEKFSEIPAIQLISWWSFSFVVQFLILHHLRYSFRYAICDAFVTNLLLLAFTLILRLIVKYYHSKKILTIRNVGFIASLSFIHLVISYFLFFFLFGKKELFDFSFNADAVYRFLLIYFLLFLTFYQLWIEKFKIVQARTIEKLVEIEMQLKQAELANIQQQLQPHLLFNSFNSISALLVRAGKKLLLMVSA